MTNNYATAFANSFQQDELLHVSPSCLVPDPDQDRTDLDTPQAQEELRALAAGMAAKGPDGKPYGVRRPIEVFQLSSSPLTYQIIAGERRWRGATIAQLETVPILNRVNGNPATWSLDMLTENINRKQLSLWDTACALQKRIDRGEFEGAQALADALGRSKAWISKYTKVLKLSPELQELARDRIINDVEKFRVLEKLEPERLSIVIDRLRAGDDLETALDHSSTEPNAGSSSHAQSTDKPKALKAFIKLELSESESLALLTRLGLASPGDSLTPEEIRGLIISTLRGS